MAELKAEISIENVVHNLFKDAAKRLWNEHGLRVDSVRFEWMEISTTAKCDFLLRQVDINSKTFN